jgi:hypothetical protein
MGPPIMPLRPYVASNSQFYDAEGFHGVDIFLLDQFSNPGNPLDFGGFDLDSGTWLGNNDGLQPSNYGLEEGWNNRNDGPPPPWSGG